MASRTRAGAQRESRAFVAVMNTIRTRTGRLAPQPLAAPPPAGGRQGRRAPAPATTRPAVENAAVEGVLDLAAEELAAPPPRRRSSLSSAPHAADARKQVVADSALVSAPGFCGYDEKSATLPKDEPSRFEEASTYQRALDQICAFFPQTDLGNAERFACRYEHLFIYSSAEGWLWWDGGCWQNEGAKELVLRAGHECVRAIQHEADWYAASNFEHVDHIKYRGTRDEKEVCYSETLRCWGRKSETTRSIASVQKHAAAVMVRVVDRTNQKPTVGVKQHCRQNDLVRRFLTDCTSSSINAKIQSSDLYKVFVTWCRANGESEWTATRFGRAMRKHSYRSHRSSVIRWIGIKLNKDVNDFVRP